MKNRFIKLLTCLICVLCAFSLFLTGCRSVPAKNEGNVYYSFTDSLGNSVTLKTKPQRVAVLFSSYAEMWRLAGGEISVTVGESIERGFADSSVLLVDDGAGKKINTELLISYKPDFIIASADISAQSEACDILRNAGFPAALFKVETFDDYSGVMRILCDITGNEKNYADNVTAVKNDIDAVFAGIPKTEEKKKILFIRCGSSYSATKAKTANQNFVCAMLNELGTYNIAENAPVLLEGLSFEEILVEDPDYIFFSTMGDEKKSTEYMNSVLLSDMWQELSAIKNNNYAYLPKDMFQYKPNNRWAQAYAYLAGLLYGEQ